MKNLYAVGILIAVLGLAGAIGLNNGTINPPQQEQAKWAG